MNRHNRLHIPLWIVTVGLVLLIAGHGFILYYISAHAILPTAFIFGVVVLVVLKHLGFLSALYRVFQRRLGGK